MRVSTSYRRPMSMGTLVVTAALLLAACGGNDAQPGVSPTPSAAPTADGLPEGTPVPELLSAVRCEAVEADADAADDEASGDDTAEKDADSGARWIATGAVSNPSKNPVSFQVSVYVGAPGKKAAAATQELVDVKPDATVKFTLKNVPAADPDGPCHVQLLSLPDD